MGTAKYCTKAAPNEIQLSLKNKDPDRSINMAMVEGIREKNGFLEKQELIIPPANDERNSMPVPKNGIRGRGSFRSMIAGGRRIIKMSDREIKASSAKSELFSTVIAVLF